MKTLWNRSALARIVAGTATAAVSLALAGCVSLGEDPPDLLLRLSPEQSQGAGTASSGEIGDAFVVLDPQADRSLDVLRVPVRVDDSSVAYLQDALWVEKPTRQFRSLLAEALRTRTNRLVVEGFEHAASGKTLVNGRLLRMGYDVPTSSVVVRFEVMRSQNGSQSLATRRFEAVIPGIEAEAEQVGPALNAAANQVAGQVADWLAEG